MTAPLPPTTQVTWQRTHRIISSKYPPIALFEDIADPADWELLASAEGKTNPRLFEGIGNLSRVPIERRVAGPGASYVMAPFVHASPDRPGRFHDGEDGAYYAGDSFEVALFETIFHFENFLRATDEPTCSSTFRELIGSLDAELHDLRGGAFTKYLDPASYLESHRLTSALREAGSPGVLYPSVRHAEGQCVALFFPDIPSIPVQASHYRYHWDGTRVTHVTNLSEGATFKVVV
ncbi:MAG: RES family NAD+ phosphorylase [Paracoccaceae bacterium]